MELYHVVILGFVMGVVTSICGGAGIFAVPLMIALGVPAVNVLTLNRMSDVGVVLGSLKNYIDSKSIDWSLAIKGCFIVAFGAILGVNISLWLPENILKMVILVGVSVGIFFLIKPVKRVKKSKANIQFWVWLLLWASGVWSGALGMAGGMFSVLVFVRFFHKEFLPARTTQIVMAIPETLISTSFLVFGSTLTWQPLVTMFFSSFVGAWLGAKIAVKQGSHFIQKAMIGIAVIMVFKVLYDLNIFSY
ncbi:hypothetical protein CSB37_03960 [bacterium DOLZORAL124_38_8]|nr:MAG: hypothetical protein CSB37_03960 [bacterium DOLZORAL124_38_8]